LKKKGAKVQKPINMSPLEAVTNLVCILQLSDNTIDYEEKTSWDYSIIKLFPNYSRERAEKYMQLAYSRFKSMNKNKVDMYLIEILNRIKVFLKNGDIQNLEDCIKNLVLSDGILMSSESEVCKVIENQLDIQLDLRSK
tara:strand:+ start:1963 stop:2379 length:417 start_codon:yes stop_codon:yes gene_type:complete